MVSENLKVISLILIQNKDLFLYSNSEQRFLATGRPRSKSGLPMMPHELLIKVRLKMKVDGDKKIYSG